ncbi:hypothetical protein WCLP8_1550001 [uncultured Gammaproteobacteria bacterium]
MLSTNATYSYLIDNLNLSGKVGWMMAYDWSHAYTEDTGGHINKQVGRVGEVSIGGRAGYTIDAFEPFVGLTYAYDPILGSVVKIGSTGKELDRDEMQGLLGINWTPNERVTAGIEVSNSFFRERQNATILGINARVKF